MPADTELRFHAVADAAQDAIIAADDRGFVTFWNRAAADMFGYTAEDIVGTSLTRIMPERFRDLHLQGMRRFMTTGEAHVIGRTVELVARRQDGSEFPVELTLGKWKEDGDVAFTGIIRDITERQRATAAVLAARDAAEQASRAKSDFLTQMSHELRTPLNSIIGFANILLKDAPQHLTTADRTYLDRIHANGLHLLSLINQILNLSVIETGSVNAQLSTVDLDRMTTTLFTQYEALGRSRPIVFRLERPSQLAPLVSDESKMQQLLSNLLDNALKFTNEGTITLRIEADPTTQLVRRIQVADTGIGIPSDRLSAIFEPFVQVETGTARKYSGAGLGLAISRALCQTLGYQLRVESTEGLGTTFTIEIPS